MTETPTQTDWAAMRKVTHGLMSVLECVELAHWAAHLGPVNALEVGHYSGLSTLAILEGLPTGSHLTTIDHHNGDNIVRASPPAVFLSNLSHSNRWGDHREVGLSIRFVSYQRGLLETERKFGFVFYDGAHTPEDCEEFWSLLYAHLQDKCVVAYDDADWRNMTRLGELAEKAGFRDVTRRALYRGAKDKNDPTTYTIKVLER